MKIKLDENLGQRGKALLVEAGSIPLLFRRSENNFKALQNIGVDS